MLWSHYHDVVTEFFSFYFCYVFFCFDVFVFILFQVVHALGILIKYTFWFIDPKCEFHKQYKDNKGSTPNLIYPFKKPDKKESMHDLETKTKTELDEENESEYDMDNIVDMTMEEYTRRMREDSRLGLVRSTILAQRILSLRDISLTCLRKHHFLGKIMKTLVSISPNS